MLPNTGATFRELIVRVAEALGVATYVNANDATDNRAAPPTNPHDLDVCKRAVNSAITALASARRWNVLRTELAVTLSVDGTDPSCIGGDPSTYALPDWFANAALSGVNAYGTGQNVVYPVTVTGIGRVREALAANTGTGWPQLVCFTAAPSPQGESGAEWQWRMVVYPKPSEAFVMRAQVRVAHPPLVRLTDRHLFGRAHDETVAAHAVYTALRNDRSQQADVSTVALWKAEAEQLLRRSGEIDDEATPRTVGSLNTSSEFAADGRRAADYLDHTLIYNGVPIAR